METTVRLGREGMLTLPAEIVERYRLEPGDAMRLLDLGGVLVLATAGPSVTDLALEIEQALTDAGVTMDEMLASLREERQRYVAEKYGIVEE